MAEEHLKLKLCIKLEYKTKLAAQLDSGNGVIIFKINIILINAPEYGCKCTCIFDYT